MERKGYMKDKAAADYLKCSTITLAKDRCDRKLGIPFYKLGRSIRYLQEDLDAWMEAHKVAPPEGGRHEL